MRLSLRYAQNLARDFFILLSRDREERVGGESYRAFARGLIISLVTGEREYTRALIRTAYAPCAPCVFGTLTKSVIIRGGGDAEHRNLTAVLMSRKLRTPARYVGRVDY